MSLSPESEQPLPLRYCHTKKETKKSLSKESLKPAITVTVTTNQKHPKVSDKNKRPKAKVQCRVPASPIQVSNFNGVSSIYNPTSRKDQAST